MPIPGAAAAPQEDASRSTTASCRTERSLSTLLRRMTVNALIVSLVDPDGFIAAVEHWLPQH